MGNTYTKCWDNMYHYYFLNEVLIRHKLNLYTVTPYQKIIKKNKRLGLKMLKYMPINNMSKEIHPYYNEKNYILAVNTLLYTLKHIDNCGLIYTDVKPEQLLWDGKQFMLTDMEHVYLKKNELLHQIIHSNTPKYIPQTYHKLICDCEESISTCFTQINNFAKYYKYIYLPQVAFTILALGFKHPPNFIYDLNENTDIIYNKAKALFNHNKLFNKIWNILNPVFKGEIDDVNYIYSCFVSLTSLKYMDLPYKKSVELHITKHKWMRDIKYILIQYSIPLREIEYYSQVVNNLLNIYTEFNEIHESMNIYYLFACIHIADLHRWLITKISGKFINYTCLNYLNANVLTNIVKRILRCPYIIDYLVSIYE